MNSFIPVPYFPSYEKGENYVVVNDVDRPIRRSFGNIEVILTNISGLIRALRAS
jgi:predicted RNase H-like HicB family nuclease